VLYLELSNDLEEDSRFAEPRVMSGTSAQEGILATVRIDTNSSNAICAGISED